MTDNHADGDALVLVEVRALRADMAAYRAENHAQRGELAAYRAEVQAQRAENQAIIDRLARAIDALESDMGAVVRRLFGDDGPPA